VQTPFQQIIRPWKFAGIMLTYWCSARCRFCYVSCSPEEKDWVDPADAVRWWRELGELARSRGKTMKIHLSGGEPFGNWPLLREVAERAHAEGLTTNGAFQKVETNGFWASDEHVVAERLSVLDKLGMGKLAVSADPYHQEFVDPQCVRRCVETARRVLGPDRVQVRWAEWLGRMQDLRDIPPPQRDEVFRRAYETHKDRLTGRASVSLAGLLETRPASRLAGEDCRHSILAARHVHIDPYGNVFPGTCAGIILGNAKQTPIAEIFQQATEKHFTNPVLCALVNGGPGLLLRYAQLLGFEPQLAGYAAKCHLCAEIRRFLFERHVFEARLGPRQVYSNC